MSFYGKIINTLSNAFGKIKTENDDAISTANIEALKFTSKDKNGGLQVTLSKEDNEVIVTYDHKEQASNNNIATNYRTDTDKTVIVYASIPGVDKYGHTSLSATPIRLNLFEITDDNEGNITISVTVPTEQRGAL